MKTYKTVLPFYEHISALVDPEEFHLMLQGADTCAGLVIDRRGDALIVCQTRLGLTLELATADRVAKAVRDFERGAMADQPDVWLAMRRLRAVGE